MTAHSHKGSIAFMKPAFRFLLQSSSGRKKKKSQLNNNAVNYGHNGTFDCLIALRGFSNFRGLSKMHVQWLRACFYGDRDMLKI